MSPGVADRAPMTTGATRYFGRVIGIGSEFAAMYSWTIRAAARCSAPADVAQGAKVAVLGTHDGRPSCSDRRRSRREGLHDAQRQLHGGRRDRIESRRSARVGVRAVTRRCSRCAALTHLETMTIAAEQAGDTSRIATEIGAAAAARGTAWQRRGVPGRLHGQDRGGEGADQGALHLGRGVRAGEPAAARSRSRSRRWPARCSRPATR